MSARFGRPCRSLSYLAFLYYLKPNVSESSPPRSYLCRSGFHKGNHPTLEFTFVKETRLPDLELAKTRGESRSNRLKTVAEQTMPLLSAKSYAS